MGDSEPMIFGLKEPICNTTSDVWCVLHQTDSDFGLKDSSVIAEQHTVKALRSALLLYLLTHICGGFCFTVREEITVKLYWKIHAVFVSVKPAVI